MNKLYEIECQRSNVTPKEFYNYCKKSCKKKGINFEEWCENFEQWSNPSYPQERYEITHEDEETHQIESLKILPYDIHLFLQRTYNFIFEFDFDTDKRGFGYFYLTEFK